MLFDRTNPGGAMPIVGKRCVIEIGDSHIWIVQSCASTTLGH
jgi:hypothetical protein